MPTQTKIDLVASLTKRFSEADNIYITDYAGLNVEQITKLRKSLRDSGIGFVVAKNTLMQIAAKGAGYNDMREAPGRPHGGGLFKGRPQCAGQDSL